MLKLNIDEVMVVWAGPGSPIAGLTPPPCWYGWYQPLISTLSWPDALKCQHPFGACGLNHSPHPFI